MDVFNLNEIENELAIDATDLVELYKEYFREMQSDLEDARKYVDSKNIDHLKRTVHNIKGVSANLSIQNVFKLAADLDSDLKSNQYKDLEICLNNIEAALDAARVVVGAAFSSRGLIL